MYLFDTKCIGLHVGRFSRKTHLVTLSGSSCQCLRRSALIFHVSRKFISPFKKALTTLYAFVPGYEKFIDYVPASRS
jgi:hypothetical protein